MANYAIIRPSKVAKPATSYKLSCEGYKFSDCLEWPLLKETTNKVKKNRWLTKWQQFDKIGIAKTGTLKTTY